MREQKISILIADDEVKIARVLRDFLTAAGYDILVACDGEAALDTYYRHNREIDLILLDIMMPGRDGISVLQEIRKTSLVPVIMLTARGEEYDQVKGFQSGADDYIVKPFSQSVLLLRIETLLKRLGKGTACQLTIGELSLNTMRRTVSLSGCPLSLTRREFDLLFYFAVNVGQTVTREQLLDNVWGYDFDGDARTVDTHIKQLRSKLGSYASALKTVYRVGYQFDVCRDEDRGGNRESSGEGDRGGNRESGGDGDRVGNRESGGDEMAGGKKESSGDEMAGGDQGESR